MDQEAQEKTNIARPIKYILLVLLGVLFITSTGVYFIKNKKPAATKNDGIITYSTDDPDESKKNAENYNWKGAPDEPKKIIISKIGVDAYVQKAGVDQNQRVAVPDNIHLASWFAESQKPGQSGLSVISGHVTGKTSDGIFKQLGTLTKGDTFTIELGSGAVKNYKVMGKVQVKEAESTNYLFSQNPKVKNQVNVITCGGKFNKASNQYEDRVIVSAELQ